MKVRNYREVKPETVKPGASLRWVIGEKEGAPNFIMRVAELEPGASTPLHTHDYEHEVFVLAGHGVVQGEEGQVPLGEGDTVFIPPMEQHRFLNQGQVLFRFI